MLEDLEKILKLHNVVIEDKEEFLDDIKHLFEPISIKDRELLVKNYREKHQIKTRFNPLSQAFRDGLNYATRFYQEKYGK